jgi:hypothetical protein
MIGLSGCGISYLWHVTVGHGTEKKNEKKTKERTK